MSDSAVWVVSMRVTIAPSSSIAFGDADAYGEAFVPMRLGEAGQWGFDQAIRHVEEMLLADDITLTQVLLLARFDVAQWPGDDPLEAGLREAAPSAQTTDRITLGGFRSAEIEHEDIVRQFRLFDNSPWA